MVSSQNWIIPSLSMLDNLVDVEGGIITVYVGSSCRGGGWGHHCPCWMDREGGGGSHHYCPVSMLDHPVGVGGSHQYPCWIIVGDKSSLSLSMLDHPA